MLTTYTLLQYLLAVLMWTLIGRGVVRVLMELLRSDPSNMIGPFRLNLVVGVLVLLTGALILIVADRRRPQRR